MVRITWKQLALGAALAVTGVFTAAAAADEFGDLVDRLQKEKPTFAKLRGDRQGLRKARPARAGVA